MIYLLRMRNVQPYCIIDLNVLWFDLVVVVQCEQLDANPVTIVRTFSSTNPIFLLTLRDYHVFQNDPRSDVNF